MNSRLTWNLYKRITQNSISKNVWIFKRSEITMMLLWSSPQVHLSPLIGEKNRDFENLIFVIGFFKTYSNQYFLFVKNVSQIDRALAARSIGDSYLTKDVLSEYFWLGVGRLNVCFDSLLIQSHPTFKQKFYKNFLFRFNGKAFIHVYRVLLLLLYFFEYFNLIEIDYFTLHQM